MALPFAIFNRPEVSEQALGGIPLGSGIVVEDKPSELSCVLVPVYSVQKQCCKCR